jgi:hypothetical protein
MRSSDQFLYSDLVDPEEVAKICSTRLMVRKSRHWEICDRAREQLLKEWEAAGGFRFPGGGSTCGHLMALGLCKPERLAVLTRYSEFYFAVDGKELSYFSFRQIS